MATCSAMLSARLVSPTDGRAPIAIKLLRLHASNEPVEVMEARCEPEVWQSLPNGKRR